MADEREALIQLIEKSVNDGTMHQIDSDLLKPSLTAEQWAEFWKRHDPLPEA